MTEENGNYGTLLDDKSGIAMFNNGQQWTNDDNGSQEDMNFNQNNSQDGDDTENNQTADMDENGQNNSQTDLKSRRNNPNLEPEQFRKVFIGGLSYKTDDETLKNYFLKYGELVDYVVMKDGQSGRSRGFGFVTYSDSSMVDELMKNRPHIIDGRQVEPKRATPREDSGKPEVQMTVKKLFIGGLKDNVSEEDLKSYFGQYGNVTEAVVMREKETNKARGFGFISFDDYDPVDKIILEKNHQVNGVNLHVQKALPKDHEKGGQNKGGNRGGNFTNDNFNFPQGNNFNNFSSGGGGFRGMGMPNNFDNGFGNNSLSNTYGSYNQAPGQPKMNMGGGNRMGGNNMGGGNKMGGGPGPMRRGGGFSNRSSGPYGGGGGGFGNGNGFGNNNNRGSGGRGGGGRGGSGGRGGRGGPRRGGNSNGGPSNGNMNNQMNNV